MPSQDLLQTFQMSARTKKKVSRLCHTSQITMTIYTGKGNKHIKKQSGFSKFICPRQSREPCSFQKIQKQTSNFEVSISLFTVNDILHITLFFSLVKKILQRN